MWFLGMSFVLLLITVLEHLIWCRLKRKETLNTFSFGIMAIINLTVYIASVVSAIGKNSGGISQHPFFVTSIIFNILMSGIFLAFYYGVNIDSPTRSTLQIVKKGGKVSEPDLLKHFEANNFVLSRLKALVDHSFAVCEGGRYRLTPPGIQVAKTLERYEKIFGRRKGG